MRDLAPNATPTIVLATDVRAFVHDGLSVSGSFSDPDDGDSWTGRVDYGDGAGTETLALASDKTFRLAHRYRTPGDYQVTVRIADRRGATGTAQV